MKGYLFFIFIAVISVVWLIPSDKNRSVFQTVKHPQEYMNNVSMWSYHFDGTLKHALHAQYWAYLPESKSSTLMSPHLTVYKPDQTIWHIDAKHGKILQPTMGSIDQVELYENVVVERPATRHAVPIKLETSELRYQPKTQYAETDKFITMSKPDLKITGIGMRAFLDRSFVELLQDVKTSYVATHH